MIPSEIRRGISAGCDFKCIRMTCQIGSFSASIVRLRGIKGRRRKPLYHLFHRIFPDLRRIRAAVQAGKCLLLVVANPDRHRIIWRHAAEPAVTAAVGRTGLSGRLYIAAPPHRCRRTFCDNSL